MLKFALALALATAAAPTFALAQDSYDQYCGPDGQCSYRNYDDEDYGRYDRDYDQDNGRYDRNYDYGRGDADDRGAYPGRGYSYTGRVGTHWVDQAGRQCAWREVTWLDTDGYSATKWVADCR